LIKTSCDPHPEVSRTTFGL